MHDPGGADEAEAGFRLHAVEDRSPEALLSLEQALGLGGEIAEEVRRRVVGDGLGRGLPGQGHGLYGGVGQAGGVHLRQLQVLALPRPLLGHLIGQRPGRQDHPPALGPAELAVVQQNRVTALGRGDADRLVEPPGLLTGFVKSSRQRFTPDTRRPRLRRFRVT